MDHRERILNAIAGRPTDRIPWSPRMDLWYQANQYNGTLPAQYRTATLDEILADNDWAFHTVVPDFRDLRGPEDDADRALGIYNLAVMPFRTAIEGVPRTVRTEGDRTMAAYVTPSGTITTATVFDESMRRAGITITHTAEYPFKSAADYAGLTYIFKNARIVPNYEGFAAFDRRVGGRGAACGFMNTAASPMQFIQKELMPYDLFFLETADHPAEMTELAAAIGTYWDQLIRVAAASPARILFCGGNFDATVTYPPFFAEHMTPWIRKCADALHAKGKYLLCHTDGENTGLLEEYLRAGFDIADSVCPAPMTKLTMADVRRAFDGRITIFGGIPSVALLKSSMPDREFDRFLDRFFGEIGRGDRLVLGISDTTPPDADFGRLQAIAKRIEAFGPVQ